MKQEKRPATSKASVFSVGRKPAKPSIAGADRRPEKEDAMNWETVEGKWTEMRGKVRETWAKLTDSDLEDIGGKKDRLIGRLQQRYGYKKEEASREADRLIDKV